jgi:hypothetical protein
MRSFELIEVVEHKASPSPRGAYYVPDGENSGYIPTANIVASEDLKTKMFVQMKREILSWYRRYADFALVAPDLTPRMRVVLDAVSRLLEADGDIREAAE